ncbi:MAG: hypothetical protein NC543_05855 [bacterium]|nr:hypothetical protein [bacterium]MCM1374493.1 hypothetical protein [Muribaculum sp.]
MTGNQARGSRDGRQKQAKEAQGKQVFEMDKIADSTVCDEQASFRLSEYQHMDKVSEKIHTSSS